MKPASTIETRYQSCLAVLRARHQAHVLRWWAELEPAQRDQLLADIELIPWDLLDGLMESHILNRPEYTVPADLQPVTVHPQEPGPEHKALYEQAVQMGRDLIRTNKVAAFTVAGGQGARLGFDGPKGAVAVTPVREKSLFQLFAETIRTVRERYDAVIPWYVMTNPANHEQTAGFLKDHNFFGLPPREVVLFMQGMLPTFDVSGRLLLQDKHRLALAPDGHGGSLKALVTSGALEDMRARGLEIISYFQVDNPLVKPFDPLFIGLHTLTGSEMSTKVATKVDDLERVGNVCAHKGKVMVIEYTDFPEDKARARNEDGGRAFNAGNLAIHLLDVDFVERVVGRAFSMPFRRAEKAVSYIDETGSLQKPSQANAVKLEMFVFDMLPLASNALVWEVNRREEFSPVKNATGVDSLESSRRDQIARACHWLESAGIEVPRTSDGQPDATIEISPSFALDTDDVKALVDRLPVIQPGDTIYLE